MKSLQSNRWKAVMFLVSIAAFVFAPVPLCPMRGLLHLPCPGCGGTRAVMMALRGDVGGSLRMHPLAVPGALLTIVSMLLIARSISQGTPTKQLPTPLRHAWTVLVTFLIALWLARFAGMFGGPAPI